MIKISYIMTDNDEDAKRILEKIGMSTNNISKVDTYANTLLKVETEKKTLFLKIYDDDKKAKVGYKLAHLYPLLSSKGIAVPEVLRYDDSKELIQRPYLIMTAVQGRMLSDAIADMGPAEEISFFGKLGNMTARLHSITYDRFGETIDGNEVGGYIEANDKGPFTTWKDMHKEIINYRLNIFKDSPFGDLINPISSWFEENSGLIDYGIVPRLLHIDLNQKNIFVKDNEVSGIIDLDGAFIGHNEEELMRIEGANFSSDEELRQSFLKGYEQIIRLDDGYEKRRRYYYLSRLLVHIGCMIRFGDEYTNISKEEKVLRKEINSILSNGEVDFDKNKKNA